MSLARGLGILFVVFNVSFRLWIMVLGLMVG